MTDEQKETAWGAFGMLVLAVIIAMGVTQFLMPKKTQGYYLCGDTNNGMATCICVDVNWMPDHKAYCTNTPQQAIEDIKQLNTTVR